MNRVICPEVAKKPMSKIGGGAAATASIEERKEGSRRMPIPLYKRK